MSQTLANGKERYCIPQDRGAVQGILRGHCMTCRKWNAQPFKLPTFPSTRLPEEGIRAARTFQEVGLDYMGPTTVRDSVSLCKRWIALFTRLTTRAIHLETVKNLSAGQFLHVLRRFFARNGYSTSIELDKGPQFQLIKKSCRTLSPHLLPGD